MRSQDILEALTDMDDDILLRAAQDPPRRRSILFPRLQHLAAACLAIVVILGWIVASDATAQDTSIRWLVRGTKHHVEYIFRGGRPAQADVPLYEPTWIPEGCTVELDPYGQDALDYDENGYLMEHTLTCDREDSPGLWIHLSYHYVVGSGSHSFGLDRDTYTVEYVDINGVTAELFLEQDGSDFGVLAWVDKERSLFFSILFTADTETVLRFARGLAIAEGG